MPSPSRRGFTLVELMVVIVIIGILVALLIPAVGVVTRNVRNARITLEINGLEQAIAEYRQTAGENPPNFNDPQLVKRHLIKRFPRWNPQQRDQFITMYASQIDPAEALPFWLGVVRRDDAATNPGWGMRNNPIQPFSNTGEIKQYFAFEQTRLTDIDGDGWQEYESPYSELKSPYVYFDSRYYKAISTGYVPFELIDSNGVRRGKIAPYSDRDATDPNKRIWVNPDTFQIISAGQDGVFVNGTAGYAGSAPYPSGPYADTGERDNIANFTEGKTLQDAIP